jgi:type IV pilus assembly protein PilC
MLSSRYATRLDMAQFYKQMAVLAAAGIPLERGLRICGNQTSCDDLRSALSKIEDDVGEGLFLSRAMAEAGAPFHPVHATTMRAAEVSNGELRVVFDNLSAWEENDDRVYRRLQTVMSYPLMLLGFAALGLLALLRFLAPLITNIAGDLHHELPLPTRIVLTLGHGFERPAWLLAMGLGLLAAVSLGPMLVRRESVRLHLDRWQLRVPGLAGIARTATLIRMSRLLCSLLRSGLPLDECLVLVGKASGNLYLERMVFDKAASYIRDGEFLSQALDDTGEFPPSYISMLVVGENTGRLTELLDKLADLYEVDFETKIEALLRALEPILISVVGVVILAVLGAAFYPLYEMIGALGS